jgi:hypothetical protein
VLEYRYFRLTQEAQGWFLTYPHCPLSPEEALSHLRKTSTNDIKEYVVATELHKDGTPHVHAFIRYEKKVQFSPRRWDLCVSNESIYHGNYQHARCWRAVQLYCTKQDAVYITNIDLDAADQKKTCGRLLNKRIIEEPLTDLVNEGVVRIHDYLRIKACKEAYIRDVAPVLPRATDFLKNSFGLLLPVLTGKKRHFWLWSSGPDTGKTTFLRFLAASYPSHWYCYKESFQSISVHTQFLLMDEYSIAHLTVMQLNQICDGTYQYPVKGVSSVMLEQPIVVVASNKPPAAVYPNCHELVLARFSVFELGSKAT